MSTYLEHTHLSALLKRSLSRSKKGVNVENECFCCQTVLGT